MVEGRGPCCICCCYAGLGLDEVSCRWIQVQTQITGGMQNLVGIKGPCDWGKTPSSVPIDCANGMVWKGPEGRRVGWVLGRCTTFTVHHTHMLHCSCWRMAYTDMCC
jgi:hypothetical protein